MSSREYTAPKRGQFEAELVVLVVLAIAAYWLTARRDMSWIGFFALNTMSIPLSRPDFKWIPFWKNHWPMVFAVIALPATLWASLDRPHPNFALGCFLDLLMLLVVCLHLRTAFLFGKSQKVIEGGH